MNISTVATADLPAIDALTERSVLQTVDATDAEKQAFLQHIRANLQAWEQDPGSALHLKACAGTADDAPLLGVIMVKAHWNLCHLFVDPSSQSQGFGKALLTAAIDGCRDLSPRGYLRLNASRNAKGFYEHMGFRPVPAAPPPYAGVQYQLNL